ncbi:MAG: hypothetical protein ACLRWQ_04065 [Flavonifractor plautii]
MEIPGGPREILFRGADGEEYTIVRQGDILAIVERSQRNGEISRLTWGPAWGGAAR